MGRSLHNTIRLGRVSVLRDKRVQALIALGMTLSAALVWLALRH